MFTYIPSTYIYVYIDAVPPPQHYVEDAQLGVNDFNQNKIGMVEQVICANAHTFIGDYSTFVSLACNRNDILY